MGQAHSRSVLRIPSLFPDRSFQPELVVCADTEPSRRDRAVDDFGFQRAVEDWREAVTAPDVDAVWVTAPNMLHVPMIEAACAAGQGGLQREADRRQAGADGGRVPRRAGGRRAHRGRLQLPLGAARAARARADRVRRARRDHPLPRPIPVDVRQRRARPADVAVHARPGRLRRHERHPQPLRRPWRSSSSAAITEVVGMRHTTIPLRPLPTGAASHYGRGQSGRPEGRGRERGLRLDALPLRERGDGHLRGQPHDGRPGEPERVRGVRHQGCARAGTSSGSTSCSTTARRRTRARGTRPSSAATASRSTARSCPGQANAIGFEDLVAIEDFAFLEALATGARFSPGFREAVDVVSVQQALIDSWDSRTWESVHDLAEGAS